LYCAESALSAVAPIEFEGVVKRFGARTVLDDLSFEVPEGTVVGLLGPNGAGKSTAMRCLLGLQKPNAGHARILGREAGQAGFREATRSAGVIIEAPPLYKNATVIENLAIRVASMGLSINGLGIAILGTVVWCLILVVPGWLRFLRGDLK
jgi:ABC-type multidrug transport system ATPase subunit